MEKRNLTDASSDIDIVLPWVDGSDPEWQEIKRRYSGEPRGDDREIRYRDWGLLKYVFRGIEKNLPWVRKVHFITCGQKPEWLNLDCPKLHFVNHTDYIPEQWLPTFSANPIELNIHRIQGLSEKFIYINDDFFFVQPMKPEDFFVGDKPKSQAGLDILGSYNKTFAGILYSDLEVINKNFDSRKVFWGQFFKFVRFGYGLKENLKTLLLSPWCAELFPCLPFIHGPNAYLKKTFEEVWDKEEKVLSETSSHRFRNINDVNQFLFLWWQWCKGDFVPSSYRKKLNYCMINKGNDFLRSSILTPKCPMLSVNDTEIDDYEEKRDILCQSFEQIFGEKSQFEL